MSFGVSRLSLKQKMDENQCCLLVIKNEIFRVSPQCEVIDRPKIFFFLIGTFFTILQDIPHLHIEAGMYLKAINDINILRSTTEEIDAIINQLTDGQNVSIDVIRGEDTLKTFGDKVNDKLLLHPPLLCFI